MNKDLSFFGLCFMGLLLIYFISKPTVRTPPIGMARTSIDTLLHPRQFDTIRLAPFLARVNEIQNKESGLFEIDSTRKHIKITFNEGQFTSKSKFNSIFFNTTGRNNMGENKWVKSISNLPVELLKSPYGFRLNVVQDTMLIIPMEMLVGLVNASPPMNH